MPGGASLVLKHSVDGIVPGLNDFVAEDGTPLHPPVAPVFWSFRIMVGIGLLMLIVSWAVTFLIWRNGGADGLNRWVLRGLVAMTSLAGSRRLLAGIRRKLAGNPGWCKVS